MNGLLMAVAVGTLLSLPAVIGRLDIEVAPRSLARTTFAAGFGSLILIEVLAIVCAVEWLEMVSGSVGFGHELLMHLGAIAAGIGVPVWVGIVLVRVWRQRRSLRVEAWLGSHHRVGEIELVEVPSREPVAFAIPGSHPQVVISEGACDALDAGQLGVVLRHERAHLAHHHAAFLVLMAILEPLRRVPVFGEAIRRLPTWLERWIDDETATSMTERSAVRSTLLAFSSVEVGPAAFGMAEPSTVAERLDALESPPVVSSPLAHTLIGVALTVGIALGSVATALHVC